MRVEASAPGKIVLCGDYAVLQGAPAVVLALQRRGIVSLAGIEGNSPLYQVA